MVNILVMSSLFQEFLFSFNTYFLDEIRLWNRSNVNKWIKIQERKGTTATLGEGARLVWLLCAIWKSPATTAPLLSSPALYLSPPTSLTPLGKTQYFFLVEDLDVWLEIWVLVVPDEKEKRNVMMWPKPSQPSLLMLCVDGGICLEWYLLVCLSSHSLGKKY